MGTLRLAALLVIAGMPPGPGVESRFISDIASVILSSIKADSGRHFERRGSFKSQKTDRAGFCPVRN